MTEVLLTIWLKDSKDSSRLTDALNEVLRHPDIYPLIDDEDDEGWSYYIDQR